MNLLEKLFGKTKQPESANTTYFKTLTEYAPAFSSWDGAMYEQELVRSCIHAFATACMKLEPHIKGASNPAIVKAFHTTPNPHMTWSAFLYRIATIYEVDCNVAIVPIFDKRGQKIGLYPLKFNLCELVDYHGEMWAKFHLPAGDTYVIETANVCMISKYQYESDYFGTKNSFSATMRLLRAQSEAEENAIKIGSKILFIGQSSGMVREEDLKNKRDRFVEDNLINNKTGLMVYDATFNSVTPVTHKPYTISDAEMKRIDEHVYSYFGCTSEVLQNRLTEEIWDGYYEGKVEPFAIQLSDGLNKMLFSSRELINNRVMFSSNRLQFMSAASKRNMVRDMADRGVININEAREILQLPPLEGDYERLGNMYIVRGEYVDMKSLPTAEKDDSPDKDPGGDDQIYQDVDAYGQLEDGSR